jgi:hypothetical protein
MCISTGDDLESYSKTLHRSDFSSGSFRGVMGGIDG